jgi:hypothetical protein
VRLFFFLFFFWSEKGSDSQNRKINVLVDFDKITKLKGMQPSQSFVFQSSSTIARLRAGLKVDEVGGLASNKSVELSFKTGNFAFKAAVISSEMVRFCSCENKLTS